MNLSRSLSLTHRTSFDVERLVPSKMSCGIDVLLEIGASLNQSGVVISGNRNKILVSRLGVLKWSGININIRNSDLYCAGGRGHGCSCRCYG